MFRLLGHPILDVLYTTEYPLINFFLDLILVYHNQARREDFCQGRSGGRGEDISMFRLLGHRILDFLYTTGYPLFNI